MFGFNLQDTPRFDLRRLEAVAPDILLPQLDGSRDIGGENGERMTTVRFSRLPSPSHPSPLPFPPGLLVPDVRASGRGVWPALVPPPTKCWAASQSHGARGGWSLGVDVAHGPRDEGHHSRDCAKSLWCVICRKETHVTAKCVWPKRSKPIMPIVGMAADGLGFYASQYAKNLAKKSKKNILGLVRVLEGYVSAEDLETDFGFHFPWGRVWKATKCHMGFLMQFPSLDRLEELVNFPEVQMKISGVKIVVAPWNSQATAKARLHTAWIRAENVPEEIQNYQAICELGSTIGAVEEIDVEALETKDIVRFKVNVKSVSMIPSVIEIGIKPFLYDIFFKVESLDEEGWNDDTVCLGKRATIESLQLDDNITENLMKKVKSEKGKGMADHMLTGILEDNSFKGGKSGNAQKVSKDGEKGIEGYSEEKVDFDGSGDDLLSSHELEDLVKEANIEMSDSQEIAGVDNTDPGMSKELQAAKIKKGKGKMIELVEGTRKSSRLETNGDIKVTEKVISRAEYKDAFLHKREGKREAGGRKLVHQKNG